MKTQVTPEAIQAQEFFHIPFWQQPQADIFSQRAQRLHELAAENSSDWQPYLQFLAAICTAQQTLLERYAEAEWVLSVANTAETLLTPALLSANHSLTDRLFADLHTLLQQQLSPTAAQVWKELLQLSSEERSQLCQQALNQQLGVAQQDYQIWVNAVVQIIYTHAALNLAATAVKPLPELGFCPCCGTDAVGAVIIGHGELEGLRYLCCGVCNSRWHSVRARCSFCDNSRDLGVHRIEQAKEGVLSGAEAECCPSCHAYRKRYRLAKQQYADPIADDLASLALDILLNEEGWQRGGANPFLLMGKVPRH
jgi:FdhE protein